MKKIYPKTPVSRTKNSRNLDDTAFRQVFHRLFE